MADRRERCNWCGTQLLVPYDAQTFQCAVCRAVTRFRLNDRWARVHDLIHEGAHRFINLPDTVVESKAPPYNRNYPRPSPQLMPPNSHGRKRALLCGVSYYGRERQLKGSVNDVRCMRYFLAEKLRFPKDSILMLTEDEKDRYRIPTKQNIRMAFKWLVQGVRPGDSLVFFFSGHGSRQREYNMDELDGYDETLCPVDFESAGMIVDDEINATIVRPLPSGAKLHAIVDACNSGTILDLQSVCRMNREGYYIWEDQRCRSGIYKGTSGGLAISISACDDNQTCVDTTAFAGNVATGALTYSFIQAVEKEPGLTYGRLLHSMRNAIREVKNGIRLIGPFASLVNRALPVALSQEPQLSTSEQFDVYTKQLVL